MVLGALEAVRVLPPVSALVAVGVAVVFASVTVGSFFRRRKEAKTPAPVGPTPGGLPRASSDGAPTPPSVPSLSRSGAVKKAVPPPGEVPIYYEGPPDPPPEPSAHRSGASLGPPPDLDALFAQLDRLSEEIRRRSPGRRTPTAEPSARSPPKQT